MKKIVNFLSKAGIHWILIILFFVIHNYKTYYGLVSVNTAVRASVRLVLIFAVLFGLLVAFTKNQRKASLMVTVAGICYLFFGNMKDFFSGIPALQFFSRYLVLVPVLISSCVILAIIIIRKPASSRLCFYLNPLLIIFIAIDLAVIGVSNSLLTHKNLLSANSQKEFPVSKVSFKPDVYYILLDSYPSGDFLRDKMGYDNSAFDSSLTVEGFKIIHSKSNYNKTPFSISSVMNFDYLQLDSRKPLNSLTYTNAMQTTRFAAVPRIFKQQGYSFSNLSIFDFAGHPSIHKVNFLSMPEKRTLLYNTFPERFRTDISWNFRENKGALKSDKEMLRQAEEQKAYNNRIIDSLLHFPNITSTIPRFVYAHLMMPHAPFFYDEQGQETPTELVLTDQQFVDKKHIISYLKFTNKVILRIVNTINTQTEGNAIIILQSDHGFPTFLGSRKERESYFMNFTAVHLPGGQNSLFPDSISMVNTFPVLFNNFLNTHLPVLKDSTVFLDFKEK